jgi:hypothetical protein
VLDKKISLFSVPTSNVPRKYIDSTISDLEYSIRQYLGKGLEQTIRGADDSALTISVSWQDSSAISKEGNPIELLTDHGYMQFFDYVAFFQSLSGVSLDEDVEHLEKLFPVMISRIPKPILNIFGCFSLSKDIKGSKQKSFCLPLRISLGDYTAITYISAAASVWISFLQQSCWEKIFSSVCEEKILPQFVPCSIGTTTIHLDDYKSLRAGDIFIIDNPLFGVDGVGTINIGHQSASVVVDNSTLEKNGILFLNWHDDTEKTLEIVEVVDLNNEVNNEIYNEVYN